MGAGHVDGVPRGPQQEWDQAPFDAISEKGGGFLAAALER
jgi:acetylornithine deacetylase/succinyl-diaminopimelate desuccinylase-like protein